MWWRYEKHVYNNVIVVDSSVDKIAILLKQRNYAVTKHSYIHKVSRLKHTTTDVAFKSLLMHGLLDN